ncbi:MAG: kinase-like domain-containing protein [Monoraphidium minutum]|nr:MAG: kinase-like domain-containing protein [Monoraphidium minutum]
MAGIPPHPSAAPGAPAAAYAPQAMQHAGVPGAPLPVAALNQGSAEFFLSNYRLGKTLGIGSFGKVKVAEHILTGHKVAIKILNRRKIQAMDMEEKVRREIKILRLFMHPHIIRLYEVIETPTDIYVVMEYVKGGELFDHIVEKGRLPEDEARHFFQQIISGVEYCHRNMVVHRDLKPENLLLDSSMAVKIADFGLSNVMHDGHFLKTSCGSPNYAAPEVISGKLYAGPEVDVWSCGVILYALLCGSLPFDDENIPNLFKKIKGGIYNLPSHLSPGARDLIPRMLLVDPLKRITIPEVRCHPWFAARLPRYLAVMQADAGMSRPRIDSDIVAEVSRLGFDCEALVACLRRREANKATVAYYLIADSRRRTPSSGYLSGEMREAAAAAAAGGAALGAPHGGAAGGHGPHGAGGAGGLPQQRLVAERRWRLGVSARGHPSALMAEVYRALQANGVSWKKAAPYNLKCRRVVTLHPTRLSRMSEDGGGGARQQQQQQGGGGGGADEMQQDPSHHPGGPGQEQQQHEQQQPAPFGGKPSAPIALASPGHAAARAAAQAAVGGAPGGGGGGGGGQAVEYLVKFECQLYKLRDEEYAVDVQRLEGDVAVFLDVCGKVLGDMRGVVF